MSCGLLLWWRIFLLDLFFVAFRFFSESIGVKLPGKIFDSGDDPRGGAINGITDYRDAALFDGFHDAPPGKRG